MRKRQAAADEERPAVRDNSLTSMLNKSRIGFGILTIMAFAAVFLALLAFVRQSILLSLIEKVSSAAGTVQGAAQGLSAGGEAGKEEGLSAKDTAVRVANQMETTGRLQVLLADMKLSDIYEQGDSYGALYSLKGEGVFTVDLSQATAIYDEENDRLVIEIPRPEFEPYIDNSTLEICAEYKKRTLFNGDARDGYRGYLNSRTQLDEKIRTEFSEDPELTEQAEASARRQVEQLARSVCQSAYVEVRFKEEE